MTTLADEESVLAPSKLAGPKLWIAPLLFAVAALYLSTLVPTIEIAWVSAILLLTIYLFVFEIVEVDVAAVSIMVLLGLTSAAGPLFGIEQPVVIITTPV